MNFVHRIRYLAKLQGTVIKKIKRKGFDKLKMEYGIFKQKLEEITGKPISKKIENKFLGLGYNVKVYNPEICKPEHQIYSADEILSAVENSKRFMDTIQIDNYIHRMNTYIKLTGNNLFSGYYDADLNIPDNYEV